MHQTFEINTQSLQEVWSVPHYFIERSMNDSISNNEITHMKFRDIAEVVSGKYMPNYVKDGVPYLRVDNIRSLIANLSTDDVAKVPLEDANKIQEKLICKEKDVLIARTGTLGKAVLATRNFEGFTLSQHVSIIRVVDNSKITPGTLCLYLNSENGRKQLIGKGAGSTRLELTHAAVEGIQVPILPMNIQEVFDKNLNDLLSKYYDSVSTLEAFIKDAESLLDITEDLKPVKKGFSINQSILDDLWIPKRYKPSIIEVLTKIKSEYKFKKLGEIAEIKRGKGTRVSEYTQSGIPFLRTSSLINHSIDPFPDHYTDQENFEKFNQPISDGDMLFSMEGKIGEIAMLNSDMQVVFKNHIEMIRVNKIDYGYTFEELVGWIYLILSGQLGKIQNISNTVVQSTIPGLSSRLREYIIPLVPNSDAEKATDLRMLGKNAFDILTELIEILKSLQILQNEFNLTLGSKNSI